MIYNGIKSVFVMPVLGPLIGLELDITSTAGLAKCSFEFFLGFYGKTQMNILANLLYEI